MKVDTSLPLEYSTEENRLKIFGFWLFLGAEIALFSMLFATYFTLLNGTGDGPTAQEIFCAQTSHSGNACPLNKQLHMRVGRS